MINKIREQENEQETLKITIESKRIDGGFNDTVECEINGYTAKEIGVVIIDTLSKIMEDNDLDIYSVLAVLCSDGSLDLHKLTGALTSLYLSNLKEGN